MASFPLDELRTAYEDLLRVSEECAAAGDFNAYAELFTEDCTYVEHVFGEMHGREAVREWIVPLMKEPLNAVMTYTRAIGSSSTRRTAGSFCVREPTCLSSVTGSITRPRTGRGWTTWATGCGLDKKTSTTRRTGRP